MYMLTKRQHTTLKGRLTRAITSGNPRKVIGEAQRALAIFEEEGFPDDWHRWDRALGDATWELASNFRTWKG